jgi:hypothetical protein
MRLLYSLGGGNMSRTETVDVAQTVTHITANCKLFNGMAVKAVYSSCSTKADDRDIAIGLASKMLLMEESMNKHTKQLIAVGIGAVETMRARELYDRRYPAKKIAKTVGVSREAYMRNKCWVALRRAAKDQLSLWVKMAETEIYTELNRLGWIM